MIAKIFSKTNPLHYVFMGFWVVVLYFVYIPHTTVWDNKAIHIAYRILLVVLLLGSVLLSDFITHKNNLTKNNNYSLLLFTVFTFMFPSILLNDKVIISNFFLLLALRRIISLQSLLHSKEKIFDASLWIVVASLFHFWCLLYFILVFIAILSHVSRDYRNWLVPLFAVFTVGIVYAMVDIQFDFENAKTLESKTYFSFDFTYFENIYQHLAFGVFTSITLLIFTTQFADLGNKPLSIQATYKKIVAAFVIGIAIYVFSAHKNNSFLAYSFAPLSIMGTNLIENIKVKWIKEISLYLLVLVSLFFFFMNYSLLP